MVGCFCVCWHDYMAVAFLPLFLSVGISFVLTLHCILFYSTLSLYFFGLQRFFFFFGHGVSNLAFVSSYGFLLLWLVVILSVRCTLPCYLKYHHAFKSMSCNCFCLNLYRVVWLGAIWLSPGVFLSAIYSIMSQRIEQIISWRCRSCYTRGLLVVKVLSAL